MIRFTWLQFRTQAAVALAVLVAFAVILVVTGPHLGSLYTDSGITGCHGSTCGTAASEFLSRLAATSPYPIIYALGVGLILAAPALVGIFWGAPLIAREFETRTFSLAWTQSITRARWLVVKLALTGLAAMLVTEAFGLLYAWWAYPISRAIDLGGAQSWQFPGVFSQGRLSYVIFASHGVAPLGYAAFGFALGTATGAVIRRAVPAIAITLAIFAAVQVAMPLWVRPHLLPPDRTVVAGPSFVEAARVNLGNLSASAVPGQPGAWILASGGTDAAGRPVSAIPASCVPPSPAKAPDPGPCIASRGIREAITYQPASRYWPLQWIETGIFLALAFAITGICFWRLSRQKQMASPT